MGCLGTLYGMDFDMKLSKCVVMDCIEIIFQSWYLVLVAVSLVARTYADVWMIQNGTAIERYFNSISIQYTNF